MKKDDRTYKHFLEDISIAIDRIEEYCKNVSFDEFLSDQKTIDAVIRNFEIIGEASKRIPLKIKSQFPDIPWDEMYYLRNKISHEYFGIDYKILWDIIKNHLPENKIQISQLTKITNDNKTKNA